MGFVKLAQNLMGRGEASQGCKFYTLTLLGRLKSGDEILGSLRATGHSLNNLEVQSPSFLYISAPRMILEGEVSDST